MKEINRSRRDQLSDADEDNRSTFQLNSVGHVNRNDNQITMERKQSTIFLHSINSLPKVNTISNDLTPLTSTVTALTALTSTTTMPLDDTDVSMKSVVFSKENPLEYELLSHRKHVSLGTLINPGSGDCPVMTSDSVLSTLPLPAMTPIELDSNQRRTSRWNFPSKINRLIFFIGCSSLSFIAGLIFLLIIL